MAEKSQEQKQPGLSNTCDFPNTSNRKHSAKPIPSRSVRRRIIRSGRWTVRSLCRRRSLEIGERLQTLSGDVKVVQQKLPRPGPQPVFNLEVHYEHVYFVGEDGVLVHNAYGSLAERQATVAARSAGEVAERARVAGLIKKARAMPDPGVDRLVSKLEKNGIRVKDVGAPLYKPNGDTATDIDILLDNAAIQVKKLAGSKKISDQIRLNTEPYTPLPVIGFIVRRGRGADRIVRNAAKGGILITNDPQLLIDVVRP